MGEMLCGKNQTCASNQTTTLALLSQKGTVLSRPAIIIYAGRLLNLFLVRALVENLLRTTIE